MKKLSLLLIITTILSMGCNKDNDTKMTLTARELSQTVWEGTLLHSKSGDVDKIGISFASTDRGAYEVISTLTNGEPDISRDNFAFGVDEKILYINPASSYFLRGNWFLTEKTNEKLVFKLYPESETVFIITLHKKSAIE